MIIKKLPSKHCNHEGTIISRYGAERKIRLRIHYEVISEENSHCIEDLCNDLMAYQKHKAKIHPEFFDGMSFKTRMIPSLKSAKNNFIVAAIVDHEIVGYAYSTISPKQIYSGGFATLECDAFFDFDSVINNDVGCLSQFFIKEDYRKIGIGSVLFKRSIDWLSSFKSVRDQFIFVSNGNDSALKFYLGKGFRFTHQILDGFIIVLRNI